MRRLLTLPIRGYRLFISPMTAPRCRFLPTCSEYALEAVERHGPVRGGWLALRRLSRCHRWHPGGVDEVPEASDRPAPPHHPDARASGSGCRCGHPPASSL